MQEETLSSQPVTAELLTLRFQMLSESADPRKSEFVITDLNEMLGRLNPEEARSIHTELHRQRAEIENQTAMATDEPISSLQSVVDNQFQQNIPQMESAENQLEAARVLARSLQTELLNTQNTLLQETIGQPGSQRRENLTYINQAIGAVALKMVAVTK